MKRQPIINHTTELDPKFAALVSWFREQLIAWFELNKRSFPWREATRTPYELVVAEILLQRTPASSVAKIYHDFLERFPSWAILSRATSEDLEKSIKGLGLSKLKVGIFQNLCKALEEYKGNIPTSRADLEAIKGVGQYTASTILAIVHGQREPFVDVNMARVLGRFFGRGIKSDVRDDPELHVLARYIVNMEKCLQINWAILDLSASVCKFSRPTCEECPLQKKCQFLHQDLPES